MGLFRGDVPNWGTGRCRSVSGKSLNLHLKVHDPIMSSLAEGGQRCIVQVGNIDLIFKVADMLLLRMDLVLKLAVVLFQVNNHKRARIRVLSEIKRSSGTHWRWGLNRGSRRVICDPVWLA